MRNSRMTAYLMVIFLLAFSGCAGVESKSDDVSVPQGFTSDAEFGNWSTYYYQEPEPERIPSALMYFCETPMFESSDRALPMAAFFTALFLKDSALMRKTYDNVSSSGTENDKFMLITVLSLTNTKESSALLEKAKSSWKSKELKEIITRQLENSHDGIYKIPVDNPTILDMLWASFFATGDELPVQRIISALQLMEGGGAEGIMVGGAANWSLGANARQHPRVLEICKEELKEAEGITKEKLKAIINQ